MPEGISIIIPTLNGGSVFQQCLEGIARQKYMGEIELIVIDSGSTDGTVDAARSAGAVVRQIAREDFSHSGTRNTAAALAKFDNVILTVQDAIPVSENLIETMEKALRDYDVVAAYGAQTPHDDADLYARFEVEQHREHLGSDVVIQHMESGGDLGSMPYERLIRSIRLDNVCAIYKAEVLRRYPFPDISFAEDMAWAFNVIKNGFAILYHPDIIVKHSHNRTPDYRFRRSVANSISCMQILGRAKYDVSYLTIPLYAEITTRIQSYASQLFDDCIAMSRNCGAKSLGIKDALFFLGRHIYAFIKKRHMLLRLSSVLPMEGFWARAFVNMTEQHLKYGLHLIRERYSDASAVEIRNCIDQLAFTMLGNLLGEMYVSYKLKGEDYPELDELVAQYMGGV